MCLNNKILMNKLMFIIWSLMFKKNLSAQREMREFLCYFD